MRPYSITIPFRPGTGTKWIFLIALKWIRLRCYIHTVYCLLHSIPFCNCDDSSSVEQSSRTHIVYAELISQRAPCWIHYLFCIVNYLLRSCVCVHTCNLQLHSRFNKRGSKREQILLCVYCSQRNAA
jgi:hypothetical protein